MQVKPRSRETPFCLRLTGASGSGHCRLCLLQAPRPRLSHQAQWIDALHRHHAVVEDRVRTNKAMGLHNLPAKSWTMNRGWMTTANLAADLDAWLRLVALHDQDGLADAEPQTMPLMNACPAAACASSMTARHSRVSGRVGSSVR